MADPWMMIPNEEIGDSTPHHISWKSSSPLKKFGKCPLSPSGRYHASDFHH